MHNNSDKLLKVYVKSMTTSMCWGQILSQQSTQ